MPHCVGQASACQLLNVSLEAEIKRSKAEACPTGAQKVVGSTNEVGNNVLLRSLNLHCLPASVDQRELNVSDLHAGGCLGVSRIRIFSAAAREAAVSWLR